MSSNSSSSIDNANSASTSTFVTALVFNAAVFGIELAIFTAVWTYFPAIYQPRTYAVSKERRASPLAHNPFLWPISIFRADYRDIKQTNGMDAYFFVRFLLMMCKILLPIWLISWLVLLPVNSVNTFVSGNTGLDKFIFGNIAPNKQGRYAAHLLCAWIFTFWIYYIVKGEMRHFVETRQRWLIDPDNASAKSNTVLITGVPRRYLSEAALFQLFSHLPGGVRKVWLNRDLKEMPDLHDRRVKAVAKLESAETKLLATAQKLYNKKTKQEAKLQKKNNKKGDPGRMSMDQDGRPLTAPSMVDAERGDISLAEQLVPKNKRPTHRLPILGFLPSLPLIGKKVDSIDWARQEIEETNAALRQSRRQLAKDVAASSSLSTSSFSNSNASSSAAEPNTNPNTNPNTSPNANANANSGATDDGHPDAFKPGHTSQTYPPLNSAFVLFNTQIGAHLAAQALTHHEPYRMASKSIGVAPEDVIWGNLNMNPYEARVRTVISWGVTLGLIILWAFPVAFIGAVSNIHSLCSTYSWLAWICKLPAVIVGIITGILPPALLAILMLFLPIVLRLLARFEGMPQRTGIELSLMDRYFLFQVIHSFLIVTLSSGIIASLPKLLNNPGSIPSLLASSLPKASNFFLTFVILQGLSGTASGFLQVIPLAMYYVKLYVFASTPRSIYKVKYTLRKVSWGTLFPGTTLIAVITIAYSIISPIINGLSFVSFVLFYYVWKYLFLWQLDQPRSQETGGLFFPKAINHVFVGLYLQQICLAALFFLARDENKNPSAIPEGALMVVLIAFTAFFHLIIANSYGPLKYYLPLTLAESGLAVQDKNLRKAARELDDQASIKEKDNQRRRRESSAAKDKGSVRTRDYAASTTTQRDPERGRTLHMSDEMGAAANEDDDRGIDEEEGPKDFYHPASVEPQKVVWLPQDNLGLADAEEEATRQRGIAVATEHAKMDQKAHVDIDGPPPDEKKML